MIGDFGFGLVKKMPFFFWPAVSISRIPSGGPFLWMWYVDLNFLDYTLRVWWHTGEYVPNSHSKNRSI